MLEKIKNVGINTWIRVLVWLVLLVNQFLVSTGVMTDLFDESEIYDLVSIILFGIQSFWVMWKNNSFTPAAIASDTAMHAIKEIDAVVTDEIADEILNGEFSEVAEGNADPEADENAEAPK